MSESDELTPAQKWELLGKMIGLRILQVIHFVMSTILKLFSCGCLLLALGFCVLMLSAVVQSCREGDWETRLNRLASSSSLTSLRFGVYP